MPSNCQDFVEPQDLLKDFVEVSLKKTHNNFEHENSFNQLNYWKPILHSIVISTFVGMVVKVIIYFQKITTNRILLNNRSHYVV